MGIGSAEETWTAERIDALGPGREMDVLIATRIMGRKVRFMKGVPTAWDGENKPVMYGPDDWMLEDYDPKKDGAIHPLAGNTTAVFRYSDYDFGMAQVMRILKANPKVKGLNLHCEPGMPGWIFHVDWEEAGHDMHAAGSDPEPRLAVYRAALKAVLL